jgi:hypothetical protein
MAIAETRWNVDASELKAQAERCQRLAAQTTDRKGAGAISGVPGRCDAALANIAKRPDEVSSRQAVHDDA